MQNRCKLIESGLYAPLHSNTTSDGVTNKHTLQGFGRDSRTVRRWLGPWDSPLEASFFTPRLPACHSLPLWLRGSLLLSLSDVSRWFASTHCHPSVRPWPIKRAPAPISLLQFCWLFLDSIPPLISSSETSLRGSRGLVVVVVVGCWGLVGWGGVRREEAGGCMRRSEILLDAMAPWPHTNSCTDRPMKSG